MQVECVRIPVHLDDPAIEARLVGRESGLAIDMAVRFALSGALAGHVLGKVSALRVAGKQLSVLGQQVLHDGWALDNRRHTTPVGYLFQPGTESYYAKVLGSNCRTSVLSCRRVS